MTEMTRRAALAAAGTAGIGLLAGCRGPARSAISLPAATRFVGPGAAAVRAAEASRRVPGGRRIAAMLAAGAGRVDLGGTTVETWSYGGQVPAAEIRVRPGDTLTAVLDNRLPAPTTVHWHGVELSYPMDGVPVLTQPPAAAGSRFVYEFTVPHQPGTCWFHPHVGVQLDRGLYGPLIIEDRPSRCRMSMTGPSSSTTGSTGSPPPPTRCLRPAGTAWQAWTGCREPASAPPRRGPQPAEWPRRLARRAAWDQPLPP